MNLFENLQNLNENLETASIDELIHCNDCDTCFDKNYATTTRDDENKEWFVCSNCGAWCKPEERYDNVRWTDESEQDIDEEYESASIKKEDINDDLKIELNSYTKQINDKINEMYNNAVKSGVSEEAASENIEQCLNHWTAELSATTPPLAQYWNDNKFFMLYGNWFDILHGDIETTDKDFEYAIKDAKALLNVLSKYLKIEFKNESLNVAKDDYVICNLTYRKNAQPHYIWYKVIKSDENRTRGLAFGNQLREFDTNEILEICKSEEEAIHKIQELKNQELTESVNEESMKDEIIKMSAEFANKVDILVKLFGYEEICNYLEDISDYFYMSDPLEPNELYPKEPDGYFSSGDINTADEEDIKFVYNSLKNFIRKINVRIKNDINRLDFMKNMLSDALKGE